MKIQHDGKGHAYIDVNGVRFTYIPTKDRRQGRNWAGQDVISVRAYRADGRSLHRGAEIPIRDGAGVLELIAAICRLGGASPP